MRYLKTAVTALAVSMAFILRASDVCADTDHINVLFIHDLHSHLDRYEECVDGEYKSFGGAAALKTLIDEQKAALPATIAVDAGDFSMGTLYQTVFSKSAAELRTLGLIGIEATTIGNHEFDFKGQGFRDMFEAAMESGDTLPYFLLANADWNTMLTEGLTAEQQLYYDAFAEYGVRDYVTVEKGPYRIALFGLFGKDALSNAPTCKLLFKDPIESAKETVARIKSEEDPDMIICLSHCGSDNDGVSEDGEIAKAVPDIDLIISGHSHKVIEEPIVSGNTTIVSCGNYGRYLGKADMERTKDGRWKVSDYELIEVDEEVAEDPEVIRALSEYTEAIDREYMSLFGYSKEQVLAHNDIAFDTVDDCYSVHTEHNLGDIIADAFMYAADNASDDDVPVDFAVCASGCIRGTFAPGDINAEDAYNSYSLGIGPDGRSGYPLIDLYLTGEELMTVCEIDASMSDLMDIARLYMSGLEFTYNPNRVFLGRVSEAHLRDKDGNVHTIEKDRLYRVVCDLYMGQMLSSVTDKSFGLIKLVPKNADGTAVTDFEDAIFYRNGEELKAWQAVADYMSSFPKGSDGIGSVPEYYRESIHQRKAIEAGYDPVSLFKNTRKLALIIYAVGAVAVVLVISLLSLPFKIMKKNKKNKTGM